jgi:hypothetical protein
VGEPMEVNAKRMNKYGIKYIKVNFYFMIIRYKYKIIHTFTSESFGGNEIVILNFGDVFIKIVKDREQYGFYFTNGLAKKNELWYDLDIIKPYIEKKIKYVPCNESVSLADLYDADVQLSKAKLDMEYIKNNFEYIISYFENNKFKVTQKSFKKFERQRAKLRYG